MDGDSKFSAGQVIAIVVTMAGLLLWMDGWSHSLPMMVTTAGVALFVFLGFRNKKPSRKLTYSEQVMLERESAHRWMAKEYDKELQEEANARAAAEAAKPKLTLIEGGRAAEPSDTTGDGQP